MIKIEIMCLVEMFVFEEEIVFILVVIKVILYVFLIVKIIWIFIIYIIDIL